MSLEVFGVFLASIIQGIMLTIYGLKFTCKDTEALKVTNMSSFYNETLDSYNNTTLETPNVHIYNKLGEGYLVTSIIMGTIYLLCCLTTFLGTEEMKDIITDKDNHFISSITAVFRSKSYITLLLAFLFNSLSGQVNLNGLNFTKTIKN